MAERQAAAAGERDLLLATRTDVPFKLAKRALLERFEREYLVARLRRHQMNVSATSRAMQVSRKHVRKMMEKHGLVLERRLRPADLGRGATWSVR